MEEDLLPPTIPAWVHKRDGRLVPFEADKISRALFAATESLGRPNAFLSRELADGVLHFLQDDSAGVIPSTAQVAELVAKVVRELGQPLLAEAFESFGRQRERTRVGPGNTAAAARAAKSTAVPQEKEVVLRFPPGTPLAELWPACVRQFTLQTVFARDIVAARDEGLLTLTGLEAPGELAGCVLGPLTGLEAARAGLIAALEQARRFAGGFVALDGPEHLLSRAVKGDRARFGEFAHELEMGLRLTGLRAVVNLNAASPPSWAGTLAEGPLFPEGVPGPAAEQLARAADGLVTELLRLPLAPGRVRVDWHLGERDFRPGPGPRERLLARVLSALQGEALAFVFDRTRQPLHLAEGLDRDHPAALLTVGVHLPRLAEQPGVEGDPERFLRKLGSLARLALSAAIQKREFLRRRERARPESAAEVPALSSGFLLDRAWPVVAPVGLDAVVQRLTGRPLSGGGTALDFGRRVVQHLREVLRQAGRAAQMETCLDGPWGFRLTDPATPGEPGLPPPEVAGLTPWDALAPVKAQYRAGAALHTLAGRGTLGLFLPASPSPDPEQVANYLHTLYHHTEVVRLHLVRPEPTQGSLPFPSPATSTV